GGAGIVGLNGSGRASAGLNADLLLGQGIDSIAMLSPHAVTVPGAVDAWARILEDHGTWGLDQVLAPAIGFAEDGFAVTPRIGLDWFKNTEKLSATENAANAFLRDGKAPVAGDIWRFPELAQTLKTIAAQGRDGFYKGPVAEDMVAYLQSAGATHTLEDFANAGPNYVDPISASYGDLEVVELPPNGQGMIALIILNILAGYDLASMDPVGVERLHLEAEAIRIAFELRDAHLADPTQAEVPVEKLLSSGFTDELRAGIDLKKAGESGGPSKLPAYRDTVYLSVVDKDRNACSFINSLFFPFGSGHVAPKSGVIFQNRGCGFVVEPGHPNCVAPNKRPMHTIIPGMALREGRVAYCFGVMGGNYQPAGHAHVLTNMVNYGMDPQEALDCPRIFHDGGMLDVEPGIAPDVMDGLAAMGHKLSMPGAPLGGGQIIGIDWEKGTLAAASEPRKDGCAIGY
ncbi:MAG: gamma-glutamyltransferase family protein, partial [Rhodospirillales bacterium]|nr:gamma-glutamyltransferase family protein [Rhodospirillales bacterium]